MHDGLISIVLSFSLYYALHSLFIIVDIVYDPVKDHLLQQSQPQKGLTYTPV